MSSETKGWTARWVDWEKDDYFYEIHRTRADAWSSILKSWFGEEADNAPLLRKSRIAKLRRQGIEVVKVKLVRDD